MQNLWNLPKERYSEFKAAYDLGNWLWLISIWNQYNVTTPPICAGCPDSMETVEKGFAKWFEVVERDSVQIGFGATILEDDFLNEIIKINV